MSTQPSPYLPHRASTIEQITIRGTMPYRIHRWAPKNGSVLNAPPLLLTHGWMDIGASFQRCVDYLSADREVIALDWRGFGGSCGSQPVDSYSFHDYYGDLDAVIDYISPASPIDLLGHSMGGNIVMVYAGTCPTRVRRLINVEGFGLPRSDPSAASARLAQWLQGLKSPTTLRSFASEQEVVDHLKRRSPLLEQEYGRWLARHWAELGEDGRRHIAADAVHKRVNPLIYRCDEVVSTWEEIQAPVLLVEGEHDGQGWQGNDKYPRSEFEGRLSKVRSVERKVIDRAGHMVHLDQPEALAIAIEAFLSAAR
ncbi:alpha/beta fold hydrolase [Castellaniella sp. S9]|uniref:alpha/beta fold hydrolase n=1 Tax=Castellaniella sp. S9 TaxID=2993652 RepID=UPI0022B3DFB5|nr:alpha/beta hydrolase [Castellaniella sp. S9]